MLVRAAVIAVLLLSASAHAGEVTVHTDDGHVIASTRVVAPMAAARALLSSPERIARGDGRGTQVSSRTEDGFVVSDVVARSGFKEIEYTSRSCPVAEGFRGTLVASEQLRELEARWTLAEADGQLVIEYDLYVVPRLRISPKIVATLSRGAVRRLVETIGEELEREAGTAP